MDAVTVIRRLAATPGRTEKEEILAEAFRAGQREFFIGAQMAYDILITFGVQKVPQITEDDGSPGSFSFADFLALADRLRRRDLTGHAARDVLLAAADIAHADTWNTFYRAVLLKDLRCGVEEKTINKVLLRLAKEHPEAAKLMVPVFACQLAHDGGDEKHAKKLRGKKLVDIKLDGVRLLTILDKEAGTVTQRTRNGKLNENFPHITGALQSGVLPQIPGSLVLDGEIVSKSFWELMTQVNRKEGADTSDAKLALFDIIPLADFKAGICQTPQTDRHAILAAMEESGVFRRASNSGAIYVVPKREIDLDTEEGKAEFEQVNREAIAAGYEGVMLKDPQAPYECKRSAAWLKLKPFISVSLTVTGIEPGTGKYQGMIGALICEGTDDGRAIRSNVGSGLSDAQRTTDPGEWIGQVVEIKADCLSQERGATDLWSLRFPRFERFRSIGGVAGEKD